MATIKKDDNYTKTPLALFIASGVDEIVNKAKAEKKGSNAYLQVILASDDGDTRAAFHRMLTTMNDADDKVAAAGRDAFAKYIGADVFIDTTNGKERKTQDYRNLMQKQTARITFALDIHNMGERDSISITEKGIAFIKGDTKLMGIIWRVLKWNDKPNVRDKITTSQTVALVSRASDRGVGEISWAMLADVIATENGRKVHSGNAKPVTVKSAPTAVLQLVKEVMKGDNANTSLSTVESKMLALETAEDIDAFAFQGDDVIPNVGSTEEARKLMHKGREMMRAILQVKINAKVKLQNAA